MAMAWQKGRGTWCKTSWLCNILYIKVDRWFEKNRTSENQNIKTYHIISYCIISYHIISYHIIDHIITDNYVIVLPMPPAWMFTGDGLEKVECTKPLGFQVGTCVTSPVGFQVPPKLELGVAADDWCNEVNPRIWEIRLDISYNK